MKHCPKCNLDFPDSSRFCGSCGGSLSSSRRCPGCGEMLELQWTFCTSCGRPLSQSASDQASPPATPKPADMSAAPPRVSSTFQTSPSQAVTMPLSDQPSPPPESSPSQRAEAKPPPQKFAASQEATARYSEAPELYAALDLYETPSAAPRSGQLESEKTYSVSDAQSPTQPLAQQVPASVQRTTEQKTAPVLSMMESYGRASETPSQFRWWHGAMLGLFFLLLLGGLGIGGWYWWANRGSVAQTTPQVDSNPALPPGNPSASPTSTATAPGQKTTSPSADEEITRLRERRIGAKPSEADEIIAAFEDAEKKYPIDYRFPYERAKLSIKGITSHHEAFGALSLAAEKAIDNGKAQEMLDSLMADKDGDFYKLSRGHREWQTLQEALQNKDRAALKALHH